MEHNYNATLKVDDKLSFDEKRKLFCYSEGNCFVVLSTKNIKSCTVAADINSISESYFNKKIVEGIGVVYFVKDTECFSKAVMQTDVFLQIYFYDENKKIKCYKKKYDNQTKEVYNIMSRINKIIIQ